MLTHVRTCANGKMCDVRAQALNFDPDFASTTLCLSHINFSEKMSSGSGELVLRSGAGAVVASSEQKPVKKKPPKKPLEEEEFTEVCVV